MMLKRESTPSDNALLGGYASAYLAKQSEIKQVGNKTQKGVEDLARYLTTVDEITLLTLRLPKLESILAEIEKAKLK